MMENFFKGIAVGLLFGFPGGPVGALATQRTLGGGIRAGLVTGLGSSVADCLYACVGVFGLTLISDFMLSHQKLIDVVGGLVLLGIGLWLILRKHQEQRKTPVSAHMFLSGFAIAITNPATLLTFLFAFSWLSIRASSGFDAARLIAGVFIGGFFWWVALSLVVSKLKKKAAGKMSVLNKICGGILIVFSLAVFTRLLW
jgi:threonine/homoserine/homoserine lactone efflux protein